MKRYSYILFLTTLVCYTGFSQKLKKELQTKAWFCSCDFRTDSLILSETNTRNFEWEASFSPSGKVTLKNLKKKTSNTIYSYALNKNSLRMYYDHKDSLQNLNYLVSEDKEKEEGVFKLEVFYGTRYKKRNKNDVPPADNFTLAKGKKTRTFYSLMEITVHSIKKGPGRDSIDQIIKGDFLEVYADTMLLNAYMVSQHNFNKPQYGKMPYYKTAIYDSLIKIKVPLKEITKIYSRRDRFNSVMSSLSVAAFGVFLVSFPTAVAVKTEPLNDIATATAIYSAFSIPVFVSLNFIFSKKKFLIRPTDKNKNTWRFETSPGVK